jgi:hypothetical protein
MEIVQIAQSSDRPGTKKRDQSNFDLEMNNPKT